MSIPDVTVNIRRLRFRLSSGEMTRIAHCPTEDGAFICTLLTFSDTTAVSGPKEVPRP